MTDRPPRVAYAFPVSHRFRSPFHENLRVLLQNAGVTYDYIYASNADDLGKGDLLVPDWATDIPVRYVGFAGRKLVWQNLIRELFRADLLIVQQENRQLANYLLILLARLTGRRIAYFGHGRNFQADNPNSVAERWKRFWTTKVDWWFAYTEQSARIVESYGFPRERITVFNNAIDTGAIAKEKAALSPARQEALRAAIVQGSENVGVYVGGLYAEKRVPFLLESAQEIRRRVPDFHLIVIGAGPEADLVRAAGADWIHYMGPKFGMEKTELVSLAKVWLMPGLVGLAVLDSFAFETPMVTCALPYHSPEIAYLQDGVNGVVVDEAESANAYAAAVTALLTDEERRRALVQGATEGRATFTIENMAARFAQGVLAAIGRGG